jgi:hypothetical protein
MWKSSVEVGRGETKGHLQVWYMPISTIRGPEEKEGIPMYKNQADSTSVCDRCGKRLQYRACGVCDGKGYYRKLVIFKNECEVCSGNGRVLRCPDEYQHIIEDLELSRKVNMKSLYRSFRGSASTTTPVLKPPLTTTKPPAWQIPPRWYPPYPRPSQIPPPWHPSYPNPWHPMHPRNPRNQPFNPLNPMNRNPFKR